VTRSAATDLELPRVLALVAAHARSTAGRCEIERYGALPTTGEGVLRARLSLEVQELLAEEGPLSFSGIDEAEPWLRPDAATPHAAGDLLAMLSCARRVAAIRRTLLALPGEMEMLHDIGGHLPDVEGLVEWAAARLGRDGRIPDSASPALASLRRTKVRLRAEIVRQLEGIRRANPQAASDAPPTLRRDRYCLPVHSGSRSKIPGLVLDSSGSGATVYLEPYGIVELNNQLTDTAAREREEVQRILAEVAAAFAAARGELAAATGQLARLDAAQARVLFGRAVEGRVVIPGEGNEIRLVEARHPLLDERLHPLRHELFGEPASARRAVVPLDLEPPEGVRTLLISGPNAGGKTVVLKTIGLMVLMAHHGIPLPAREGTAIPAMDALYCHIGDEQDVAADLSTFSASMAFTARALREATPGSLVLYDELGAGTDPLEGAALGFALLEELNARGTLTVATTHLAAIAMNAASAPGMENAAMGYDEAAERPTYTILLGRAGRSRGLEIASAMGVPAPVLGRARELLGGQHLELERWLARLEAMESKLETERARARQAADDARRERDLAATETRRLEAERREQAKALAVERDRLRRAAAEKLDRVLTEIERATKEQRHLGRRRREQLRTEALEIQVPGEGVESVSLTPRPGDPVRVPSLGGSGTLEAVRGSQARVAIAGKHLWVPLEQVQRAPGARPRQKPAGSVRVEVAPPAAAELDLRGMDAEGAREELEHALDRAMATGAAMLRVVHGHGTGTLRKMVQEICRRHPAVRSFRHPPGSRGGTGATEITLRGEE